MYVLKRKVCYDSNLRIIKTIKPYSIKFDNIYAFNYSSLTDPLKHTILYLRQGIG